MHWRLLHTFITDSPWDAFYPRSSLSPCREISIFIGALNSFTHDDQNILRLRSIWTMKVSPPISINLKRRFQQFLEVLVHNDRAAGSKIVQKTAWCFLFRLESCLSPKEMFLRTCSLATSSSYIINQLCSLHLSRCWRHIFWPWYCTKYRKRCT